MTTSNVRYDVIDPKTTGSYGSICYYKGLKGWMFVSMISGRGNGRKAHETAEMAIPNWAKKNGAVLSGRRFGAI